MVVEEQQEGKKSTQRRAGRPRKAKSVTQAWGDFKSGMRSLLPEEFWEHRRAARREFLLAARSLIDVAIERLEEEESSGRKRAQKIEIE